MDFNFRFKKDLNKDHVFNYFTIYSLLINKCKPLLENIFISRWYQESGEQWKSVNGFGVFLANKLESAYDELSNQQKLLVDSGLLEQWDIELLSTILLKSKYTSNDKSILDENKSIMVIKLYCLKVFKQIESLEFFLDNEEFNKIQLKLKEALAILGLKSALTTSSSLPTNEKKAFALIGEGKELLKSNYYIDALACYSDALKLGNISLGLRSVLYCDCGSFNAKLFKRHIDRLFLGSNEDLPIYHHYLKSSIISSINSIGCKNDWYAGYSMLAQALEMIGFYELAIRCFECALSFKSDQDQAIKDSITLLEKKISLRSYKDNSLERDHEKESLRLVSQNGLDDINQFIKKFELEALCENTNNNSQFIKKLDDAIKRGTVYFENDIGNSGNNNSNNSKNEGSLDSKQLLKIIFYEYYAISLFNQGRFKSALYLLCKSAPYGFSNSLFHLAFYFDRGCLVSINKSISLALVHKSTLSPKQPSIVCKDQYFKDLLNVQRSSPIHTLALRYISGANDDYSVDFAKGLYYLDQAVVKEDPDGMFLYGLLLKEANRNGHLVFKFQKDTSKAIQLFKKAASMDHEKSKIIYGEMRVEKSGHGAPPSSEGSNSRVQNPPSILDINDDICKDPELFRYIASLSKSGKTKEQITELVNIRVLEMLSENQEIKAYTDYVQSKQYYIDLSKKLFKRELQEEYSIDFSNVQRLKELSSNGSTMATNLLNAFALFTKFIKLLESNPKSPKDQLECIKPLCTLYLSSESYIAYHFTSEQKKLTSTLIQDLYEKYFKSQVIIHIAFIGFNLMANHESRESLYRSITMLTSSGLFKDNLDLIFLRGKIHRLNYRVEEAVEDFQYVINKNPDYQNKYIYFLAAELMHSKCWDDSNKPFFDLTVDYYNQYIKRSPSDGFKVDYAAYCISDLYHSSRKEKEARLYLNKALSLEAKQLSIFNKISKYHNSDELKTKYKINHHN